MANNEGGGYGQDRISTIYIYQMFLAKEKSLYTNMNKLVVTKNTVIGYFWGPADMQKALANKLASLPAVRVSAYENHAIAPPTYIKTNEFTEIF